MSLLSDAHQLAKRFYAKQQAEKTGNLRYCDFVGYAMRTLSKTAFSKVLYKARRIEKAGRSFFLGSMLVEQAAIITCDAVIARKGKTVQITFEPSDSFYRRFKGVQLSERGDGKLKVNLIDLNGELH
ncbi:MAG: hypothetical protein GY829_05835 [Gammaproteobacteria bacterium]|nr:hypothetical protein [Gammaproteobacteria bacterium]